MRWLPVTFGAVVLSFFAATALGQWKMRASDRDALEIADNSAPSIEHLASARTEIRHLQLLEEEDLDRLDHGDRPDPQPMERVHRDVDQSINDYLVLPVWPGERALWSDMLRAKDVLDKAVLRFESEITRGNAVQARSTLHGDAAPAAEDLSATIMRAIELNAAHSHDLAVGIRSLRGSATYAVFGLDLVSALIAIVAATVLRRMMTDHARLLERYRRLDEERASELEQFAGRVAHDILSPLNGVAFALQLAGRPKDEDHRARVLERGTASVQRVKRLVDGLLDFARAGARPDPDSRADVRAVLADLATELQPSAADAGIELSIKLSIEDEDARFVRCHPGVLTSLISNLARNAIKYIGDSAVRRMEIRALDRGDRVRVEVEDTGPGLAPDVEARVFEPYARGRDSMQPGIGLGLATVKRLAESHGGRAGVHSVSGHGCRFWFELPKAAIPTASATS